MTLTKEDIQELRKPFRADQVKFKIQTQPKGDTLEGWGVVVSYLDARDVAERLDLVIGGAWHDEYNLFGKALECSLTVQGVTRRDVGEADSPKELYSDAFKRAAVKFGVGAFLYRMPTIMAKLSRKDQRKPWGLTDEAKGSLRAIAEAVASGSAPAPRYPGLMLLSEYQAPDGVAEAPQKAQPQPARTQSRPTPTQARQDAPPQGADPVLNNKQAESLHARLGMALKGTEWDGQDDKAFVAGVLGFKISSFTELKLSEAKQLTEAAEKLPKIAA